MDLPKGIKEDADNWQTCPRCYDEAMEPWIEKGEAVFASYGLVTLDEFTKAFNRIPNEPKEEDYYTFREDYEFYGADEGVIKWQYSGSCTECGLSASESGEFPFYTKKR